MAVYTLEREQFLKSSIEKVWDFISSPKNLKIITPDYMGFDILNKNLPDKMYPGIIINYKVSPLLGIKLIWSTEITHIREYEYFVDEQKVGPYKFWHHQHHIKEYNNGVMMTDIVNYTPPFGLLGNLANELFIRNKLKEIFDYREKVFNKIFNAF